MSNVNIGNAFPLEKLDSDLARNNYNYQSILNGLIKWNNSSDDNVCIRLTTDSAPWYADYVIPTKKSTLNVDTFKTDVLGEVSANSFVVKSPIDCVVYGGSKKVKTSTFNASGYTATPSKNIVLVDAINFNIGDIVMFRTDSGTIPTAISSYVFYYIISKTNNTVTVSTTASGSEITLNNGSGTITMYKFESSLESDDSDKGDIVTFRTTVFSSGLSKWALYYVPSIYTYIYGNAYKAGNYVTNGTTIYRTIFDSISTDTLSYSNIFRPCSYQWSKYIRIT